MSLRVYIGEDFKSKDKCIDFIAMLEAKPNVMFFPDHSFEQQTLERLRDTHLANKDAYERLKKLNPKFAGKYTQDLGDAMRNLEREWARLIND